MLMADMMPMMALPGMGQTRRIAEDNACFNCLNHLRMALIPEVLTRSDDIEYVCSGCRDNGRLLCECPRYA